MHPLFSSFVKITSDLNICAALDEILSHDELWEQITARQNAPGTEHADTRSVFLRWAASQSLDAAFNDIEAVDYPAVGELPRVMKLVKDFVERMKPRELGRVLLVSLKPDGHIGKHIDEGAVAQHYARFHIPIISEEGNMFFVQNTDDVAELTHMKPGELWWFNNKKTHWVSNMSSEPRLHLIIDAVVEGYT